MKILISTDIEGVAGVFHHDQVRAGNPEYERARLLMTHEANAAITGAEAGATEVLVNDSHGGFRNMPPDLLDPRAQAVMGKPRYLSMMAGVDDGVNAVCMIGYHSRARPRHSGAHHQRFCFCACTSMSWSWAKPAFMARWPASTAYR